MKIDTEIYYKLYYSTLDLKIKRAEEDLYLFEKTFSNIKDILKAYRPYIVANVVTPMTILLISPSSLVKGKLADRYVEGDKLYTKEAFYTYYNNYRKNFIRLQKHKDYIESLKRKKVSYKVYQKIIKKFNLKVCAEIVYRKYVFNLGYGLGQLFAALKVSKKDKVNWDESNKNKQRLIDAGKIPYYKEDAERVGEGYQGVKWLILHPKENVWIHHKMTQVKAYKFELVKSNLTESLKYYLTNLRNRKSFNPKEFPLVEKY
tara:strand:+ start:5900 stop:6679 length:780 start_codon:yes stop_codon:yes gene_type:complete